MAPFRSLMRGLRVLLHLPAVEAELDDEVRLELSNRGVSLTEDTA